MKERGITCEMDYLPGKHYDAYHPKKGLPKGLALAIDWYKKHLLPSSKL